MLLIGVNASAQLSIGAGYVNSQVRERTSSSSDVTVENTNGLAAGVSYSIPLAKGFAIVPGVYYTYTNKTGMKSGELFGLKLKGEADLQEHYVTVPLHLSFGAEINPDFKVFLFAGPSFCAGIASTIHGSADIAGGLVNLDTGKFDNYGEDSTYGRFDVLVGGGIGFDLLKRVRFKVGYDCGMLNRYTGDSDGFTRHRNQLCASAAFLF